jgi:hypothetical protein
VAPAASPAPRADAPTPPPAIERLSADEGADAAKEMPVWVDSGRIVAGVDPDVIIGWIVEADNDQEEQ